MRNSCSAAPAPPAGRRPWQISRLGAAAAAAIGAGILTLGTVPGNLSILAAPVALWVGVRLWPQHSETPTLRGKRGAIMRWAAVAIAWCLAAGVIVPKMMSASPTERTIARQMEQVEQMARSGRWLDALRALDAIDVAPEYPLRRAQREHNRGVLLLRLGRRAEAAAALQQAVSFDSGDADACAILGRLFLESGQTNEALPWLERAHAIEPERQDVAQLLTLARAQGTSNPATSSAPSP